MSSTGLTAKLRPVRIGWCVRKGSFDQLRTAMRLSTMLWGGRYNPMLPVDDAEHAKQLCELFRVDALFAPERDAVTAAFIEANKHVGWPLIEPFLSKASDTLRGVPRTALMDVGFVISAHAEERRERGRTDQLQADLGAFPQWSNDDPIADALLANFGAYPADEWGGPLEAGFTAAHGKERRLLDKDEMLPGSMIRQWSPLALTGHGLWPSRGGMPSHGVFMGSASSYDDLLEFWNLSAADHGLVFYDHAHRDRYEELMGAFWGAAEKGLSQLPKDDWRNAVGLWSREHGLPKDFSPPVKLMHHSLGETSWNGLNEKPPLMSTAHVTTIASITTGKWRPTMTFQVDMPEMFNQKERDRQFVVVTIRTQYTGLEEDGFTFAPPNIPEMNQYFGREMLFEVDHARVGPDGLGIIMRAERSYCNVTALPVTELFQKIFEAFGMIAKPSRAGMIARRLIRQMGGIQGCRVFKIAGVRHLIGSLSARKAFTHAHAMQVIGPGFGAYEGLFIESREKRKLESTDAFLYLVGKGVFRAGLEFRCPTCELDFWVLLDDAATMMDCEYCGARFNATTQLRYKGGWRYRRSGLFGRDDHQEGAVPVTLVLQRLDTSISDLSHPTIYTTALEIQPASPDVPSCEIDFVFLAQDPSGKPQLIFGEAKNRKEIGTTDLGNICSVAAAFPRGRLDVYPTFAKLADFTRDELERCLEDADAYPKRHILLSLPELEPYDTFHRFADLGDHLKYSSQSDDLAEATQQLYRKQLELMPGDLGGSSSSNDPQ